MKAFGFIFLVAYIAFCTTLYVASRRQNVTQDPGAVTSQPVPAVETAAPPAAPNPPSREGQ